eukprot:Skav230611  [mRNA]  locus=scaffold3185:10078:10794:+ [translate_table: standard]
MAPKKFDKDAPASSSGYSAPDDDASSSEGEHFNIQTAIDVIAELQQSAEDTTDKHELTGIYDMMTLLNKKIGDALSDTSKKLKDMSKMTKEEKALRTQERNAATSAKKKAQTKAKNEKNYAITMRYKGKNVVVHVHGRTTVKGLREAFASQLGLSKVAAKKLCYVYNGKLMNDNTRREVAGDWHMTDGSVVDVKTADEWKPQKDTTANDEVVVQNIGQNIDDVIPDDTDGEETDEENQ